MEPQVADALADLLRVAAALARERRDDQTARAATALGAAPTRWRAVLNHATTRPDAAAFFRTVLATWLDEAVPGRAQTAEDGVGRLLLGAILVAATATANVSETRADQPSEAPPPDAAAVNLAAARVSFLLRFDEQTRPSELAGRAAPLVQALGAGADVSG